MGNRPSHKRARQIYAFRGTHGTVFGLRGIISQRKRAELRTMGEVGQYIVGMIAGLSEAEIQRKREWTEEQLDQYREAAIQWADEE